MAQYEQGKTYYRVTGFDRDYNIVARYVAHSKAEAGRITDFLIGHGFADSVESAGFLKDGRFIRTGTGIG